MAKTFSAISGDPDISCFLLLDDSVNELLLSLGLGVSRILTLAHHWAVRQRTDSRKAILCLWAKVLG